MINNREQEHLLDYWRVVVRRRWVIYATVAIAGLTALIASFLATPLYQSTAVLQIERQSPDILSFRDLARTDYSFAAYENFYRTQYKIIASSTVAKDAVDRLGLSDDPGFTGALSEPGVVARAKGWVRSLIPSKGITTPMTPEDVATAKILGGLQVIPVRDSNLVRIAYTADDPVLAADVANAVTNAYIRYSIQSQSSTSTEAGEFLFDQINQLRKEIAALEDDLRSYGEAKRIISIDDSNNITFRALQDISEARTRIQSKLAEAEARYEAVKNAPADGLPEVLESSLISRLRQEYAALETELAQKTARFKPGWPDLQNLESKLRQSKVRLELETEQLVEQVRSAAYTEYERLKGEAASLTQMLTAQEEAALKLKRDALDYAEKQNVVDKKRETLNVLIARQNEMELSTNLNELEGTSTTNIRVMEAATSPAGPFRPNTRLNLMLGLVLGSFLGIGAAFLLEYLDNTLLTSNDVERAINLPTLASVPWFDQDIAPTKIGRHGILAPSGFDTISFRDSRNAVSEAYRELRTAILLSHAGEPPKQLMITSAVPEEGKSSTTINLGIVLAQLGAPVLVMDTDLRRPRLHKVFDCDNRAGVSTYLSGMEEDVTQLTIQTSIPNLSFIPSGPVPPNPSELVNSRRFIQMGADLLDAGFSHIVYDSAPVLSGSDPVIIASVVETSILVVRAGSTPRQSVRLAVDKLRQSGKGPSGVVLNGVDPRQQGPNYYSYYTSQSDAPAKPRKRRTKPKSAAGS